MDAKILCLGVVSRGPCSGYEIRKQFEEGPFAHFQDAGFGSIYPALKRLTEDGMVSCIEQPQDSRPDKKVYRITAKGRQALFEAIQHPPASDKLRSDGLFTLFFADLLSPGQADRLLDERIAYHRGRIAALGAWAEDPKPAGEDFVLRYGLHMHQAALAFYEQHRHELIGALLQQEVAE